MKKIKFGERRLNFTTILSHLPAQSSIQIIICPLFSFICFNYIKNQIIQFTIVILQHYSILCNSLSKKVILLNLEINAFKFEN